MYKIPGEIHDFLQMSRIHRRMLNLMQNKSREMFILVLLRTKHNVKILFFYLMKYYKSTLDDNLFILPIKRLFISMS